MKLVLATVLALAAAAGAAQAMSSGPVVNNCGKLVTKPKSFTVTCADANYRLTNLKWSTWGPKVGAAVGKASVNDCKPNCAAGKFHSYSVGVALAAIKSCGSHKEFSRLTVVYAGKHPSGIGAVDRHKLIC